jgi:hypothetical protein
MSYRQCSKTGLTALEHYVTFMPFTAVGHRKPA